MAHDRVAQRLGSELSGACGLAINEFDVLLYLRSHAREQVRIGALLEAVPLSQPALSRLVARLEARDLLVRREAEDDARAVVVCLTEPGPRSSTAPWSSTPGSCTRHWSTNARRRNERRSCGR